MAGVGARVGPVGAEADVGGQPMGKNLMDGSLVDPRSYISGKWLGGLTFILALLSIPILVLVVLNYRKLYQK